MEDDENPNVEFISLTFDEYLPEHILGELHRRQIQSLIIEGGAKLLGSFIDAGLWDEARVFTGQKYFFAGVAAPKLDQNPIVTEICNDFRLDIFKHGI